MKRITVDLTKASTETLDLTDKLNPRVGDSQLAVPLHVIYGTDDSGNEEPVDMRNKDIEFLSQDTNKNDIYVSDTVTTDSKGDDPYSGNVTFVFPEGTFKVAGTYDVDKTMFRIINKADKTVLSTVNVKLNVLEGGGSDYNFDPNKTSYNSRLEDMLKLAQSQLKDKIANTDQEAQAALNDAKQKAAGIIKDASDQAQALLDDIKQTNSEAKGNVAGDTAATAAQAKQLANDNSGKIHDLQGEVGDARGRFMTLSDRENKQDFNIDRKEDKANANANYAAQDLRNDQQDKEIAKKANQSFITDYLSQMRLEPQGFANLDDLKAKYPNGNPGLNVTVDDGHLYIWYDNTWKDCGQFQTAGLDKQALEPIKRIVFEYSNQVSAHEVRLGVHDFILNNHEQRLDNDNIRTKDNQTRIENIEGAGSLKDIELTDQNGNHLTDNSGIRIGGKRWLVDTDKTLTQADLPADAKAVGEALVTKPENYDIPILYLYGAGIEGMRSKKDSVSVGLSYEFPRFNLSGTLNKIKVQGASSAGLPKKNYTLQFDQAVELINGYGKQKKYVIKANMTDFSHARNVGCAELWGKVRQTRIKADDAIKTNDTDYLVDNAGNHIVGEADPQLSIGGTYGAVDGFPIAVYINNKYWGLYTFNIPKDKGMAKMTKGAGQAIVSTTWMSFTEHTKLDDTDMGLEYCGTKDSTWVTDAVNRLIDGVKASYTSKDDFEKVVLPLLDIDSAIDYYVYSVAIGNVDGVVRNFNLQTWDGKKWYFAAYDLDMVFGRTPDLLDYLSPEYNGSSIRHGGITFENLSGGNRIFHQLWKFYKPDIIARYKELVQSVLSASNVSTFLTNYAKHIPFALKVQEDKTWPQTPLSDTNNLEQIRWWYMLHINFLNTLVANA